MELRTRRPGATLSPAGHSGQRLGPHAGGERREGRAVHSSFSTLLPHTPSLQLVQNLYTHSHYEL